MKITTLFFLIPLFFSFSIIGKDRIDINEYVNFSKYKDAKMIKKIHPLLLIYFLVIIHPLIAGYPEKNVKVIVHVSPGGGTDTMARVVLKHVGDKLGTSFIVENFKGAGGQVGYTTLAMAKPDGYTIGTITTMSFISHELTRKNVAYQLKESFIPIARIVNDPSGIFVRTESPIESIEDLFDRARKHPNMISCSGTTIWGTHNIHCILLEQICGIKLNFVPFDGVSESRNNLLGGHVDVAAGGTSNFISLLEAGKVRALVIASENRLKHLPTVPTYHELGFDLVIGSDRGFAAPKGTPSEYIRVLSAAIEEVLQDPTFLLIAERMSLAPILSFLDYKEFVEYLFDLREDVSKIVSRQVHKSSQ
jgi:tripartite-type tricarboxylate transporter receptor subunit TctC